MRTTLFYYYPLLSVVIFSLLLSSCSPSLNDCTDCLTKKFNDAVTITNANKIDGIKTVDNGASIYTIQFSCNIQFKEEYKLRNGMTVLTTYGKGEKFDIGTAYAKFVKTDNGWRCFDVEYNMIDDFYYIDPAGKRIDISEYYRMKAEEAEREPRHYTGSIDNYCQFAALNVRVNGSNISALLYDKKTKSTKTFNGYATYGKWVIKSNDNISLEGNGGEWYEGIAYNNGNRIGRFSFRETSFSWEEAKNYDAPTITGDNEDIPLGSTANAYDYEDNDTATYKVESDRAYFHDRAEVATKRKAYLVKDEVILALKEKNGYVYVEFANKDGIVTKGWISIDDIHIAE